MAIVGLFVARPGRCAGHRRGWATRVELAGRPRPAAADLDHHRAGQGAVPQQRDQPRRPDPARASSRPRSRASRSCSCSRPTPAPASGCCWPTCSSAGAWPRPSAPGAAIIQFFGGIHEIYFPYVLMKPQLILAMIAGGMTGIFINVLFDVGPARAGGSGLDLRGLRARRQRQLPRGHRCRCFGAAAVAFVVAGAPAQDGPGRRGRGRPGRRDRADGGDEGQEVVGLLGARPARRRGRERPDPQRSCSPATPAWAPPRWAPRCCARRSRAPGTATSRWSTRRSPTSTTPTTWSSPTRT